MELSPADKFWNDFLVSTNRDSEDRCAGDINFESKGFSNDVQISMILSGAKTAVFTSFASNIFSISNIFSGSLAGSITIVSFVASS